MFTLLFINKLRVLIFLLILSESERGEELHNLYIYIYTVCFTKCAIFFKGAVNERVKNNAQI